MNMQKLTALLVCLCLTVGLLAGCGGGIDQYDGGDAQAEDTPAPTDAAEQSADDAEEPADSTDEPADSTDEPADSTDEPAAEPTPSPEPGLGIGAYEPLTVVATVNGADVTWQEYYYWLNYYVEYTDYLAALGAFSYTDGWDGMDISPQYTNAEVVRLSAWDNIVQFRAMDALADELGVQLDEGAQAQLEGAFAQDADSMGDADGECSNDEADAFEDYLGEQYMTRELYEQTVRSGLLLDAVFEELYGEEGADYSDEDTLAYAEEQGLMHAKHILLMTVDSSTGESLPEEEVQAKEEKIDELYEQLEQVAEDPEALEALFDELMEANSEDGGIDTFPDGYLFGEGVMVSAFEDTVKGLEEYGLSEPVASDYGWHIILRLPIDPDGVALTADGQSASLRTSAANAALMDRLEQTTEAAEVDWENGFEQLDLGEIFGER